MADSAGRTARREWHSRWGHWLAHRVPVVFGDPRRARIVVLLASVLALNSADIGTIGAAAAQLESDLRISHAQLGLLATASSGVGAIAAVPMGVLADRINRVRLLVATIAVWVVAMVAGGLAPGYGWLLVSRLLLGAAVAASGPVVTSLTGDFIPPSQRAGVLGWILTGEIIGTGIGLLVGGVISAAFSWRYAFFTLAAASLALAVVLWRLLPEPARAGHTLTDSAPGRPPDSISSRSGSGKGRPEEHPSEEGDRSEEGGGSEELAKRTVLALDVEPAPDRILGTDPRRLRVFPAMLYLLRIPSNRLLIEASSIGYFFFAGLRTFAVIFAMRQYDLSQTELVPFVAVIGLASAAGAVFGGRVTDRAMTRGYADARILVPAIGYTGAALLILPGVIVTSVAIAIPLLALGAAVLSAANPPLDAARLDIVPGRMWGRAESLRTVLRLAAEAAAPATFGWFADLFGGTSGRESDTGLRNAFIVMLVPLLANGLIMLAARRSYPTDVATAAASDRRFPDPRR